MKRNSPPTSTNPNATGVLTESEVLFVGMTQGKPVVRSILAPPGIHEPGELLAYLWQEELASVWVMPGTTVSRLATGAWVEQSSQRWIAVTHAAPHDPTKPISALFWPKGNGQREARSLTLVFPEHAGWGWVLPNAKSLLATVTYLEQVLARPVSDVPNVVAYHLLTDLTRSQPLPWLHSSPASVPTVLQADETIVPVPDQARDLVWMRSLTLTEERQRYLHKYLHFSWHLAACMTVQLGVGAPEYSAHGRAYDGVRPGTWRVMVERAGSIFDGKYLPSGIESDWMSTPQVKCCQDIGYRIAVREGYSWSRAHALLHPWAQTLWQAAERLHTHPRNYQHPQGRSNALETLNHLAHLGMTILVKETSDGGWKRPDWWAQIVGRERAIVFARLASLARKGTIPVLVDRDAIWVISNDPNPLTAVPGLVAARPWQGYRVGYEAPLPLSSDVKAALRATEQPGQVSMVLDTFAREVGLPDSSTCRF